MKDAWFRSADWDRHAQEEFEARLARARPQNRIQYRRIKAIALLASRDREKEMAGKSLLNEILVDADAPNHERTGALSLLGAHEQDAGRLDSAEGYLRAALDEISLNRSGSDDLEEIRLAEILLARGGRQQLEEARDLVDRRAQDPPMFLAARFRLALVGARVSLAEKDRARAAEWAVMALNLPGATRSGLANHPTLGLVQTDAGTLAWLTALAATRGEVN